jgi:hypothetical protein
MNTLKNKFKELQKVDWSKATVSLYVAKRHLVNREAVYDLLEVTIDKPLGRKLRTISREKLSKSNDVRDYDYNTADLDNDVLGIETSETDLGALIDEIESVTPIAKATDYASIVGSWIYIARLEVPGSPVLFSARKTSSTWNAKKVTQLVNAIFSNNVLIDLDQKEVFQIDSKVDFFSYDGFLFIADKKSFENALNFRAGMEKNRDAIVKEFATLNIFTDAAAVGKLVGDNVIRLRKLSQVQKSGYFRDAQYRSSLHRINKSDKWGLKYDSKKRLIASEESIEDILKFLNNDRLNSKLNSEIFDVDVKHKVK